MSLLQIVDVRRAVEPGAVEIFVPV